MIIPDEKSFQLQKDETVTQLPTKKESDGKYQHSNTSFSKRSSKNSYDRTLFLVIIKSCLKINKYKLEFYPQW
jgi:hypothetical protein